MFISCHIPCNLINKKFKNKNMKINIIILAAIVIVLSGCEVFEAIVKESKVPTVLTNEEIIGGLKEALTVGTNNAVNVLSLDGGFFNDQLLKIPFPDDAKIVENKLRQLGMNKMMDDFIVTLNKGASEAVKEASPIFVNAIHQMTFADARNILKGEDNAATNYFREKTSAQLFELFSPKVQRTLDRVEVTKYWNTIMTTYNQIPFVQKVETDLSKYVTNKAIDGLFIKIAIEEKKIRTDPFARVTELLKKVFAYQ